MKKSVWIVILVAAMAAGVISCKNDNTASPVSGQGKISGTVTDLTTSAPMAGVAVSGQSYAGGTQTATTDANGQFNLSFNVDSTTTVLLSLSKTGWRDTTALVSISSGSITSVTIAMKPKSLVGPGGGGSGLAQTDAFMGADRQEIEVRGVGGNETALLSWEVRDSLGQPIDAAHAVQLSVTISNGPNGGEYISPSPITTNSIGQAYTTVTAGTRSGVMQIVATTTVGTRVITSTPVRIIIDAGFPDQTHFTIAPAQYNLPILDWVNVLSPISVLVGDRYSNPVAQGTAVYFRSSAGVIEPSVFTSRDGQGTANLISGNPFPYGQYASVTYGNGYQYIVAKTVGEGAVTITDSILVLWSGKALITNFSPLTFTIANGGSQTFSFTVSDELGHPLSKNTVISVSAAVPPPPDPNDPTNQVAVSLFPGQNGTFVMGDEIFPGVGITQFTCKLSDGTSNVQIATYVTLTVAVSGPNGTATFTIDGIVN